MGGVLAAAVLAGGDEHGVAERLLRLLPGPVAHAAGRAARHGDQRRRRPGPFVVHEVKPVAD